MREWGQNSREGGRERAGAETDVDLLVHVLAALDDGEPGDEGLALVVGEGHGVRVGDPEVDAATAGVDPEEVAEGELVAEGGVEDADGDGDECPAALADVGGGAAGADGVVVCHVDVKDKLALERGKGAGSDGLPVPWLGCVVREWKERKREKVIPLRNRQAQSRSGSGLGRRAAS
jgi:hypothetical protein